jgi:putative spermidine/putrescine transport system permease protein
MFRALQTIFGIAIVFFLLMPIFAILPLAFTSSVFLNYPIPAYSMRWMNELTTAEVWRTSIVNSLIIGGGATVLATVLGTLASLGMRMGALPMAGLLRTMCPPSSSASACRSSSFGLDLRAPISASSLHIRFCASPS